MPRCNFTVPAVLALLLLAACAQVPVPDIVFDDGPAPAKAGEITDADPTRVLTGARPIRRADPDMPGRANLGTVPPRPEAFSSPIERQAMIDRLQQDQSAGQKEGDDLRAQPVVPGGRADDVPSLPEAPPAVPAAVPRPDAP